MKQTRLILILIVAALLSAACLPGSAPDMPGVEAEQPQPGEHPTNPVIQVAVGLVTLLFGGLTLLPLLWNERVQ